MNALTPGKPRPARGAARAPAADQPQAAVRLTMDFDDDVPLDQLPDGGMAVEQFAPADPKAGAEARDFPAAAAPRAAQAAAGTRPARAGGKVAAGHAATRNADAAPQPADGGQAASSGARSGGYDDAQTDQPDAGMDAGSQWYDDEPTIVAPRSGHGARPRSAAAPSASRMPARISAITVTLSVELGRQQILLGDLMASAPGQFFTLDRLTSEPVDIMVNGQLFARGEVVVIGDQFGVRLSELMDPEG